MTWFEAVVLGVIQGLTEFLPISSSAHLRIAGEFLGDGSDPGAAFTAITQLGTEAAVLVYFRHDIARIVRAWLAAVLGKGSHSDPDARMGWLVIVGTLPIAVAGLALQDLIEDELRTLWLTASMLIVFALVLGFADATARNERTLDRLTWKHGVLFGLAQALALVPGVSRSGGTIAAGLLMGYTREAAARYSFLLAVPAVLAAGFFQLAKSSGEPAGAGAGPTALATGISFAVGYVVIVAFLRFVSTRSYLVFVLYRIALGALLLALLAAGVVSA